MRSAEFVRISLVVILSGDVVWAAVEVQHNHLHNVQFAQIERMGWETNRDSGDKHRHRFKVRVTQLLTLDPIGGIRVPTHHGPISKHILLTALGQLDHLAGDHHTATGGLHGVRAILVLLH